MKAMYIGGDQGLSVWYRFGELITQFVKLTARNLINCYQASNWILFHEAWFYDYQPDKKLIFIQKISKPAFGHSPPTISFPYG